MTDAATLLIGDRVSRRAYGGGTFEVVGWTPRGKTILRNIVTGAERSGWWPTWASLPRGYILDEQRHNALVEKEPLRFNPDWVISPGETLRDWMEENGIPSARIVASCCRDLEANEVQGVLDGKRRITKVLACKLSVATGISAQLWLNLERQFRQGLAEGKTWVKD